MTTVTFDYDDMAYESFAKKTGKDNVVQVIKKLMNEYSAYSVLNNELAKPTTNQPMFQPNFTAKKSKIGALPDIKIPDNFDDIEITDFDV